MPVTTERRNRPRTRPPGLVYAELGPSNGGMMRDLCEEGFAMRAMMPLRVGDITPFTLQLDAIIRLEGQCQVIWVREEGRLLGLRFIDNSSKIRAQIRSWLALPEEIQPDVSAAAAEVHQPSTLDELREEMRSISPREESPHEDLKILQPPVAIEPAPTTKLAAPPPLVTETLAEPEATVRASEAALPSLPRLELGTDLSASEAETASAANQHNEIPDAVSHGQAVETPADRSLTPSLEPLSIFEQRDSPRAAGSGWLDRFTLSTAVGVMLCVAVLIGGFVFHQELGQLLIWLGQKVAGTENVQAPAPAESRSSPVAPATRAENLSARTYNQEGTIASPNAGKGSDSAPVADNIPKQNPTPQAIAAPQKQSQIPSALTPMTQTNKPASATALSTPSASASSVTTGSSADGGYPEFQAARAILRSDTREGELPDAVRLLWASIEKGNTGAEVALAELYRTGRGVSKNCDQARVLLSAAANRGNADAKRELATLIAEGCR